MRTPALVRLEGDGVTGAENAALVMCDWVVRRGYAVVALTEAATQVSRHSLTLSLVSD